MEYKFKTSLDKWSGDGGWFFIRIPKKYYDELKMISLDNKRGFGSIRVEVTVGTSIWRTSIFPDNDDKSFILFVKKQIRSSEDLDLGSRLNVAVKVLNL